MRNSNTPLMSFTITNIFASNTQLPIYPTKYISISPTPNKRLGKWSDNDRVGATTLYHTSISRPEKKSPADFVITSSSLPFPRCWWRTYGTRNSWRYLVPYRWLAPTAQGQLPTKTIQQLNHTTIQPPRNSNRQPPTTVTKLVPSTPFST